MGFPSKFHSNYFDEVQMKSLPMHQEHCRKQNVVFLRGGFICAFISIFLVQCMQAELQNDPNSNAMSVSEINPCETDQFGDNFSQVEYPSVGTIYENSGSFFVVSRKNVCLGSVGGNQVIIPNYANYVTPGELYYSTVEVYTRRQVQKKMRKYYKRKRYFKLHFV